MKKSLKAVLFVLVFALVLAGCAAPAAQPSAEVTASPEKSADTSVPTDSDVPTQTESEEVITVRVGTMGTYEPFTYVDEAGNLTGYDIEVLRLIETVEPSLKFDFQTGPWDTLFPGLDADKYQLLANQITSNPDREAKYLLTENTYALCVSQLIVKEGRTDINSLEDLEGKKIGTTVGDSFTRVLEDWNNANGNILDIVYYEEDITTILQDIANGRIDATLNDPIMAVEKAKAQDLEVQPVGERIAEEPTHFIFKNDGPGKVLKEKIDDALYKLKDDGTLSQLSIDWFGADYSK